jgi:hypothetical protein
MDEQIIVADESDEVVVSVHPGGELHLDHGQLPVVREGQELVEHEVYIDVMSPGNGPFRALAGQRSGSGNAFVAEHSVDPAVWDVLVRADGEARLVRETEADEVVVIEAVLDPTPEE